MIPYRQVIVAFRGVAAAAERRVTRLKIGDRVQVVRLPFGDEDYVFENLHVAYECYNVVERFLGALPVSDLCQTEVLISAPLRPPARCGDLPEQTFSDFGWDPLRSYGARRERRFQPSLETIVAWWLLAFPEVKWFWWSAALIPRKFASGGSNRFRNSRDRLGEWHGCPVGTLLDELVTPDESGDVLGLVRFFPALFDPSGLRASIRALMGTAGRSTESHVGRFQVCRTKIVLAVDEERDYSQLEGYTAYRSGHLAWVASTWASFAFLWAWKGAPIAEVAASFEDLYLAFPDQVGALPGKPGFSGNRERLSYLPYRDAAIHGADNLLARSSHRVLVTAGHKRGRDGGHVWKENLSYLRSRTGTYRVVRKPLGSVHLLLKEAGFRRTAESSWIVFVRRLQQVEETRHSAPGRILACAERLVERSRGILKDCSTPEDALHAAILALEAKELLSGQTPTMTLEAIALQHEAEVTAESLFLGVVHNKDLSERFSELRREIEAVSFWFGSRRRERSTLNARLTIAERLARRFRDLNQIEEELECLAEARKLRFAFWVRERPWRWVLSPLLRYLAFALQSIPRFIGVVIGCGIFFGLSYYAFASLAGRPDFGFWDAMISSWKFSITAESVSRWTYLVTEDSRDYREIIWNLWLTLQGAVTLTNFGLLFSHLYLVVSRR